MTSSPSPRHSLPLQLPSRRPDAPALLRKQPIIRPIDRSQEIQKAHYDPNTIASDVLRAVGAHPNRSGLNHHLRALFLHFSQVTNDSDLSTFNWDIVEATNMPPPAEEHNMPVRPSVNSLSGSRSSLDDHPLFDRWKPQQSTQPETPPILPGDTVHSHPSRDAPKTSIFTPEVNPLLSGSFRRTFVPDPNPYAAHSAVPSSEGNLAPYSTSHSSSSSYYPGFSSVPSATLRPPPVQASQINNLPKPPSMYSPLPIAAHKTSSPRSFIADSNQQGTAQKPILLDEPEKMSSKPRANGLQRTSVPGAEPSSSFSIILTPSKPFSFLDQPLHTPNGSRIQVVIPMSTPDRLKQSLSKPTLAPYSGKKRGRPFATPEAAQKAAEKAARRAAALAQGVPFGRTRQPRVPGAPKPKENLPPKKKGRPFKIRSHVEVSPPEPNYIPFYCEWEGCPAELHNFETLRRHVLIVHRKKLESGGRPCRWGRKCQAWDERFSTKMEWKDHMDGIHLIPFSWHMGDGPKGPSLVIPKNSKAGSSHPVYLYDSKGRQVTESVENQPIQDGRAKINNQKRFRAQGKGEYRIYVLKKAYQLENGKVEESSEDTGANDEGEQSEDEEMEGEESAGVEVDAEDHELEDEAEAGELDGEGGEGEEMDIDEN